jgi:NAD+ synthase
MAEEITLGRDTLKIDARLWCSVIEGFISAKFSESHRTAVVVTVSGGLDSSVTAALCTRAVGRERVIGLMLPERWGNPDAGRYGRLIVEHLGIRTVTIDISRILRGLGTASFFYSLISGRESWKGIVGRFLQKKGDTFKALLMKEANGRLDEWQRKMNASASSRHRARVLAAYRYAEENNCMVVGSAHKSEDMAGLFVKYGIDDCADVMPMKNLYRSHILQLGEYMGVPPEILDRTPNPDILMGVTDKYVDFFGLDSLQVDLTLYGLEKGMTARKIADQLGVNEQSITDLQEIIALTDHKRNHAMAPVMGC